MIFSSFVPQLEKYSQIEHAQHLAPGSDARFGQQAIFASVQVSYFNYLFGFLLFTSCYCIKMNKELP
jgi:hypothetical protein